MESCPSTTICSGTRILHSIPRHGVSLRGLLQRLLLSTFPLAGAAVAQTATWTGPDDGSFHTAGNWSTNAVPGAPNAVIIDGETETARTVTQSGAVSVTSLTVSTGDTLRVTGGTSLQTAAAGYMVDGLLELAGGADNRLFIPAADTVLAGSGELRLRSPARIYGGGSLLLRGLVTGAGSIGSNDLLVVNETPGRVSANVSGEILTLDPRNRGAEPAWINQGRLEADGGGILQMTGYGAGWFDNTGGVIMAKDSSEVRMVQDASLAYGAIATEGTGVFRIVSGNSGYWTDLSNSGETVVDNNAELRVNVAVANSGRIRLAAVANSTNFRLQGATVLRGGGRLELDGVNARVLGATTLTLEDQTISGIGTIGSNETAVMNSAAGKIEADRDQSVLVLDPGNRGAEPGLRNAGLMQAMNGGVLHFTGYGAGWFDNTGGTVRAMEGSEVQFSQDANFASGLLTTEGTGLIRIVSGNSAYWTDVTHTGKTVVDNNSWLRHAGTLANTGTVTLQAAANVTRLQLQADTILTGSGKLVMAGSQNAQVAGSFTLTNTGGHTIEGQGNLGVNEVAITNTETGLIEANVTAATLTVDPRNLGAAGPGLLNRGIMQARNGGVLYLTGYGAGWFDNTGGTIKALDGSEVGIGLSASVAYGSLTSEGTGFFRVSPSDTAYWTSLTHAARTLVPNNSWLRTAGTITNPGTITLEAAGNATRLQLNADTVLTGSGKLIMAGSQNAQVGGVFSLNITGGQTIEGQGNLGINEVIVTNSSGGLIEANVAGQTLALDPRNLGNDPGFINHGTVQAKNGGVLYLSGYGAGWFDNTGAVIKALDGSEVGMGQSASIVNGTLTSEGAGFFRVSPSDTAYWASLTHAARTLVPNNSWLRTSGTISNSGTISLEAAANATRLQLQAETILTGNGKLIMGGSQNAQVGGSFPLTNTGGHIIEGEGNLGINEVIVTNTATGLIEANVAGQTLVLDPRNLGNDPGFINHGTVQAKNGGVLYLSGYGAGWFDNAGGAIKALEGSEVQMGQSVSIANGTLTSVSTGFFRVSPSDSAYWTSLTHSARTLVPNNSWLRTAGTIANSGTITLESTANSTRLQLQANTVLSGGGKLFMSGDNRSNAHMGGGFLLTNDGHTIEGHGNLGINESAVFNTATGLIHANVSERGLTLDPRAGVSLTNRGILRASGGGGLYISGYGGGGFDNDNGFIEALDGSQVVFVNSPALSGGVLRTSGSGMMLLPANQAMTLNSNTANLGLFTAENNTSLYISGRMTNAGTIRLTGAANLTSMIMQDNTTLAGGGTVELNGNTRISGGSVLIVEDQTVRGTGNIGWNEASISVSTKGLVIADVPGGTLSLDPTPLFGFVNDGVMRAQNGGVLNMSSFGGGDMLVGDTGRVEAIEGGRVQFDAATNLINRSGTTLTGGTWLVQGRTGATSLALPGGAITANGATIVLDGAQAQFPQITGLSSNSGSLALLEGASLAPSGAFTNAGALEIGTGSSLTAGGAVTLAPASSLTLHIGGAASAGALNSAAGNTVNGAITVVFDEVSGFTPAAGNSWTLLSGPPTGAFTSLIVRGLSSGLQATLEYTPNFVNLRLSARAGINFADWAALYGFDSPADALPSSDPDRDGLNNLLEFAFGAHPLRYEPDAAPELVVVTVAGQPYLGLRYWKPAGAQQRVNLTYASERSSDASSWSATGIVNHSTAPADASGRERITVRLAEPLTAAGRRLLRMRVTQAP